MNYFHRIVSFWNLLTKAVVILVKILVIGVTSLAREVKIVFIIVLVVKVLSKVVEIIIIVVKI